MNDLRSKAKQFYNALDFDRPINFGQGQLVPEDRAQPATLYVENLHGDAQASDAVQELADQIDFSASAGAYLFTGNRGTGKTTELLRLAQVLQGYDFEVFYADLADYLLLTQRIEITDFLIAVLGGLSEKVEERFGVPVGKEGFFKRAWSFLQSEVRFQEVTVPAGPIELKAALLHTPRFKEELQLRLRDRVQDLAKEAHEFAAEVAQHVRRQRNDPNKRIVLIVDSVERLRGIGDSSDIREVFKSAETLFSSHADLLRFTGVSVVYTVPPYLQALVGALGQLYAGGRIYALPSVHVYECCPEPGLPPQISDLGVSKMLEIVRRRFPQCDEIVAIDDLRRLAQHSGGDLRDFFRMLRLAVTRAPSDGVPLPPRVITNAENAVRADMLPIADDDRAWLKRIADSHSAELPSLDRLPEFARLQQGKYLLQYRNGADWYDVHPLLRGELGLDGGAHDD